MESLKFDAYFFTDVSYDRESLQILNYYSRGLSWPCYGPALLTIFLPTLSSKRGILTCFPLPWLFCIVNFKYYKIRCVFVTYIYIYLYSILQAYKLTVYNSVLKMKHIFCRQYLKSHYYSCSNPLIFYMQWTFFAKICKMYMDKEKGHFVDRSKMKMNVVTLTYSHSIPIIKWTLQFSICSNRAKTLRKT